MGIPTWLVIWLSCLFGIDCQDIKDMPANQIQAAKNRVPTEYLIRELPPGIGLDEDIPD